MIEMLSSKAIREFAMNFLMGIQYSVFNVQCSVSEPQGIALTEYSINPITPPQPQPDIIFGDYLGGSISGRMWWLLKKEVNLSAPAFLVLPRTNTRTVRFTSPCRHRNPWICCRPCRGTAVIFRRLSSLTACPIDKAGGIELALRGYTVSQSGAPVPISTV